MFQALQKAGVESKFVIIPGESHGFEGEDSEHALAEAVSWFEKHLAERQGFQSPGIQPILPLELFA